MRRGPVVRTGRLKLQMARDLLAEPLRGHAVLDVGAGDSPFGKQAQASGFFSAMVDLDYASGAMKQTGAVAADAMHLPFRDGAFHTTVSSFTLQHVASPRNAILEMHRVTDAGGVMLLWPIWRRSQYRPSEFAAGQLRITPSRLHPRRRSAVVLDLACGPLSTSGIDSLVGMLVPGRIIRTIASAGMWLVIRVRRTNRLDTTRLAIGRHARCRRLSS